MNFKIGSNDTDSAGFIELEGKLGACDFLLHSLFEWDWNWVNFHFIDVKFENDVQIPGYELIVILLGIGFRLRINKDWSTTEDGRELLKYDGKNVDKLIHGKGECPFCNGDGARICEICDATGEINIIGYPEDFKDDMH